MKKVLASGYEKVHLANGTFRFYPWIRVGKKKSWLNGYLYFHRYSTDQKIRIQMWQHSQYNDPLFEEEEAKEVVLKMIAQFKEDQIRDHGNICIKSENIYYP